MYTYIYTDCSHIILYICIYTYIIRALLTQTRTVLSPYMVHMYLYTEMFSHTVLLSLAVCIHICIYTLYTELFIHVIHYIYRLKERAVPTLLSCYTNTHTRMCVYRGGELFPHVIHYMYIHIYIHT